MADRHHPKQRPRRGIVITLVVVGSVAVVLAILSIWVARQVLETDTWADTSTQLLEEEDIREPLAGFLADALFDNVDVEAELKSSLPPQAQGLAGPAAGALRQLAEETADRALQRPRVQQLWEDANVQAHEAFVNIVENKSEAVSHQGDIVTLDLSTILEQLGSRVGIDISKKLPPDAGRIEILGSGELDTVQDVFNLLQVLAIGLTAVALLLYGGAIYLARGWRREALRAVGFGFIVSGLAVVIIRSVAQGPLVDSLASTASAQDAARTTLDIYTSLLVASAWSVVAYGLLILIGVWAAGPGQTARSLRRDLAALLHDRAVAYPILAFLLLLVFWWNPTPGTARLLSSLILVAVAVAGMEALRQQALRDFPDETTAEAAARWRERLRRKPARTDR
jgi:hypothetical protein